MLGRVWKSASKLESAPVYLLASVSACSSVLERVLMSK